MFSEMKSRFTGKKLVLIFFAFCSFASIYPQQFHSLSGIEDSHGNSNLIYRLGLINSLCDPIYKLDPNSNEESKIIDAYFYYEPIWWDPQWKIVDDYEFFINNPNKFVNTGRATQGTYYNIYMAVNDSVTQMIDDNNYDSLLKLIEISKANTQNIFCSTQEFVFRSFDGGYTYPEDSVITFPLISVADFDDKVFFGTDFWGNLIKSENSGATFTIVDTSKVFVDSYFKMLYDYNQFYIYRINKTYNGYTLNLSNNKGNAFTWSKIYDSENPIFITIDSTQSGVVYLADGKRIYKSVNNGYTFNLYKTLPSKLVGIYKKPNSEILYAASKYKIYEIIPDTTIVIKALPIPEELLTYYPLSIGNYWIYKISDWSYPYYSEDTFTKKVVSKEILSNNKEYFKIEEKYYNPVYIRYVFERIDRENGFVYRYENECSNPDSEKVIDDFTSEVGDSILNQRFTFCWDSILTYFSQEENMNVFNENRNVKTFNYSYLDSHTHKLAKEIGIYYIGWGYDFGYTNSTLKGCIVDGIVYGDTTLTDVDRAPNPIPTEYKLEQNYPNPFNPSTKISWQSPVGSWQTLKVYDILGNEVAILVNEYKPAGTYEVEFNVAHSAAADFRAYASGIYIYQLKAGTYVKTMKMILIK